MKKIRTTTEEILEYAPPYNLHDVAEAEALTKPLPWPTTESAPKPKPLRGPVKPSNKLPPADVLVVTWTVAEGFALADVLTPGYRDLRGKGANKSTKPWYTYRPSNFDNDFKPNIRAGAPSRKANRLGSYFLTTIYNDSLKKNMNVLCFKSELHLNRDWILKSKGPRTVPVADLFMQLIDEVKPQLVITTGTAGATYAKTALGDVMVTRAAQFRLSKAFGKVAFKDTKYECKDLAVIPTKYFTAAKPLLAQYRGQLDPKLVKQTSQIWADGVAKEFAAFTPILTTDKFEFGTTKGKYGNYLEDKGCGVEMGDAVLGMVIQQIETPQPTPPWDVAVPEAQALHAAPKWLVIRNASDPEIDGSLDPKKQTQQAVFYYKKYGYWTSVNSAITVWAVIRGYK